MNFHAKRRREEVTREHESCLRELLVVRFPPRVVHLILFFFFFFVNSNRLSLLSSGKYQSCHFFEIFIRHEPIQARVLKFEIVII